MNLNEFKSNALLGGGARPNLFEVTGSIGPAGNDDKLRFLVKAASLPLQTMGVIEVPYMGRKLKIPGDRTFEPWELTIVSDAAFDIRNKFEEWNNEFMSHEENQEGNITHISGVAYPDWSIRQLSRKGETVKEYKLVGCWPSAVGAIEVNYETNDTIMEFTVTMEYQYWTAPTTS